MLLQETDSYLDQVLLAARQGDFGVQRVRAKKKFHGEKMMKKWVEKQSQDTHKCLHSCHNPKIPFKAA